METITQTNRTLLFAEINPERLNLLTLIGDVRGKNSLDDDKVKEINEELVVSSFEEFLEKFSPVVYSWCDATSSSIQYSLVKPENIPDNCITEIPLNESNDLLNMLITLLDAKGAQGVANVDFKFSNVLDMISPKKIMEDIRQVRREIQYTYGKYMELDEGDPKRLDLGDKLNYQFEQASQNYNNVLAMLPLAIEDIKTRLLLGDGETGVEAARQIRKLDRLVELIYVTSYDSYMKEVFEVTPSGFIVKPLDQKEFEKTFHRVLQTVIGQDAYYRFRYNKEEYKLLIRDILYFTSDLRKTYIIEEGGRYMEYRKLNDISKILGQGKGMFVRIHKSYLVNYRHIVRFSYDTVKLSNGEVLPVSSHRKQEVDEQLARLMSLLSR